jgi:hypothetical protein
VVVDFHMAALLHAVTTTTTAATSSSSSPQPPQFLAWVTALSTLVLALIGTAAIWQLRQGRRARETEIIMEIGRRWDSEEMIESRSDVDLLASKDQLSSRLIALHGEKGREYHLLMREPGHLEDLGVIYYHGGIKRDTLFNLMGLQIQERWLVWREALQALGSERSADFHFAYFREMASELSKTGHRHGWHAKRAKEDSSAQKLKGRFS